VFYEVPLDKGPKIVYPAAAIKESKNKEAAGDFLKFVSSQAGKKVFRKYGFVVLE
jgi:molybdate transport system substrate-binding protein